MANLGLLTNKNGLIMTPGQSKYLKPISNTSDMQGMLWGEPELSHVWVFDHMVFFVIMLMRCE